MTKITGVKTIRTRAGGNWVFVKILTDQPGLYGIGSAHEHNPSGAVVTAIEEWFAPRLIGRDASQIEDIWQTTFTSGYWRTGPIHNVSLAGIDIALWDIKGKEAGMPVYQLLGGPVRAAVPCYAHAVGKDLQALEDDIRKYMEDGWTVIRCQLGRYGSEGLIPASDALRPRNANGWPPGSPPEYAERVFDDELYVDNVVKMFEYLRSKLGMNVKLTHDVHEHLKPTNAVTLAKLLEPYRLFFLEDLLPPEQVAWYRNVRQQCATPQAIGELFVNVQEWLPLISERLIDYIRCRISKVGGITQAQKIAHLCELFGVQTAWQEGGNTDPVNLTAAMHLDMSKYAFGIQEENWFSDEELEAFPGHPTLEHGYLYPSDKPGLGIDIDEEKAAKLVNPDRLRRPRWVAEDRRADGSVIRP